MNWEKLQSFIENCKLDENKIVIKNNLRNVIELTVQEFSYNMLKQITAVDKKEDGIELIYHLYSVADEEDAFISITTKGEMETISDIFRSAIADENEIHDLFGINFIGNDKQKRLYMPEDWEGHPLKKDYVQDDTRLAWNGDNKA